MVTNAGLRTVLIVDDEQALRSYMVRVLEDEGYAVIQAGNGVEALSVFNREDISTVHLVITDVSMPGMGGKDLAANLARQPRFTAGTVRFGQPHACRCLRATAQETISAGPTENACAAAYPVPGYSESGVLGALRYRNNQLHHDPHGLDLVLIDRVAHPRIEPHRYISSEPFQH
jgi:CheY-like chemotaxis protein